MKIEPLQCTSLDCHEWMGKQVWSRKDFYRFAMEGNITEVAQSTAQAKDPNEDAFLRAVLSTFLISRTILAVISIFANAFVIFFILRMKKFSENSANVFMLAILSVDLCFGFWFSIYRYDVRKFFEMLCGVNECQFVTVPRRSSWYLELQHDLCDFRVTHQPTNRTLRWSVLGDLLFDVPPRS